MPKDPHIEAFTDELTKIGAHQPLVSKMAAYKDNKGRHRMPSPTKANVDAMMKDIEEWDSPHKEKALEFVDEVSGPELFKMLHSVRRWYSGGTMSKTLVDKHEDFSKVMDFDPENAVGVYRGFKVPNKYPLANVEVGQRFTLPIIRDVGATSWKTFQPGEEFELATDKHGISSWSTDEAIPRRFAGGGKGKTGIIVKLVASKGVRPILVPPDKTEDWFNELYEQTIGKSFRPNEKEYLIDAPHVEVEVVRVKK